MKNISTNQLEKVSGGNLALAGLATVVIAGTWPTSLADGSIDHSDRLEQIAKEQHANDTNQFNAFGI